MRHHCQNILADGFKNNTGQILKGTLNFPLKAGNTDIDLWVTDPNGENVYTVIVALPLVEGYQMTLPMDFPRNDLL